MSVIAVRPQPGAGRVLAGFGGLGSGVRVGVGERRQVMDLVHHQQRAMATGFLEDTGPARR